MVRRNSHRDDGQVTQRAESSAVLSIAGLCEGARRLLPVAVFVVPFGVAFGAAALAQGLTAAQALAMSALVFAAPFMVPSGQLPTGEWDEWYVLDAPRRLGGLHVFVNYGDFTPSPAPLGGLDPTWDRVAAGQTLRHSQERAERFWTQLLSLRPRAYLAEADTLTCVTNDDTLFAAVGAALGGDSGEAS